MTYNEIVKNVNKLLADELYPYEYLEYYLDCVIDDINERLSSCYPTFSEYKQSFADYEEPDYTFFPAKYIRSVVIKGAAYKFYIADEEGIDTAQRYGAEYLEALFKMQRDYISEVPDAYRVDHVSSVHTDFEELTTPATDLTVQGWGW